MKKRVVKGISTTEIIIVFALISICLLAGGEIAKQKQTGLAFENWENNTSDNITNNTGIASNWSEIAAVSK